MSRLQLSFLGPFQVLCDGKPLTGFESNKVRALLAYLAVESGRPHSREALCGLLWPDWPQSSALSSLRNALADLRKNLDDAHADTPFLLRSRDSLQFNPNSNYSLDVAQFQSLLQSAQNANNLQSKISNQQSAIFLFRGPFLEGFSLPENNLFEEWLEVEREYLQQQLLGALQRLADAYEQQGEMEQALNYCRRQLAIEPWLEEEHRRAMRLLALSGQRGAALAQYETCRELLGKELGVEPGAETRTLYEAIRDGSFERSLYQAKETIPAFAPGKLVNQRYRLEEMIGEGGLGVVYRALDTLLERQVAIKVLHTTGLGTEGRAKLLREAQIVARLNHPNIITVYDAGEVSKTPYLVMELAEGTSLDSLIPLPVDKILAFTTQVCSALEYAHGHGIVHRDLKPGNILLEKNGQVKLMDFGLARSMASRITTEGAIAGTVFYMAPEQALGKTIDARADLYSLGIILYELSTGDVPFTGEDPLAVISQHLHAPVVPPRLKNEDIPESLNDLILQLLGKEPGDRPESAAEVRRILDQISKGETEVPALANLLTTARQKPPAVLEAIQENDRTVFVAREAELGHLSKILEGTLSGKGCLVFVTGDAGRGKTALLREFARQASEAHPDLLVAAGSCNPYSGVGDPYLPLRSVLRILMGNLELAGSTGMIDKVQALSLFKAMPQGLQALVSSGCYLVDTFLPGSELLAQAESLGAVQPEMKRLVEQSANRQAELAQQILFEQYCAVLRGLSREHPLLILLDDLQWADGASAGLLYHLGSRLEASRILVLCAYRPEEVSTGRAGERHPLEKLLAEYKRLYGDAWLDLERSDERRGREFVDVFLDTGPNRLGGAFRQQLFRHTGGHALFTVELLRAMQERGDLVQDPDGCWVEGPVLDWESLPARVEAVIAERIGRLDEELRQSLVVASVEGEEFTAEVVAQIRGMDTRQITRQLSEKVQKEHGLARALGVKRVGCRQLSLYRFQHNLFQQYLYNGLDPVERACLHEDVGNVLEALYGENTDEIAPQLARHFEEAGFPKKAVHYLQQSGELAAERYANQEALQYFNRALANTSASDLDQRYTLLIAIEMLHELLGQRENQRKELGELESLSKQLGVEKQGQIELRKAIFYEKISDSTAASKAAQTAVEIARQVGDLNLEANGLFEWGRIYYYTYDSTSAREYFKKALILAQDLELDQLIAACLRSLGNLDIDVGDLAEAQNKFELSLKFVQKIGDRREEAYFYSNISNIYSFQNNYECAQDYLYRSLQISKEIGDRFREQSSLSVLGGLNFQKGDYINSLKYLTQSLVISREVNDPYGEYANLAHISWINAILGSFSEAIDGFEQCMQICNRTGDHLLHSNILFNTSLLYCLLGDYPHALKMGEQALQIMKELDLNDPIDESMERMCIGKNLIYSRDFIKAQEYAQSSVDYYQKAGILREREAESLIVLGEAIAGQGFFAEAIDVVQKADKNWRKYGSEGRAMEAQAVLASIHLAQGETQQALTDIQEILAEFASGGCFMGAWEPAKIYLTAAQVLLANGDPRAEDFLRAGYNLIHGRAAGIDDEVLRRSYLENVPYNREILHLWETRE